ncbi:cytochrome P450 [Comamonas sp. JC664]|uniref:cytochrome P450 n=1 Tax=Comamonas sp. JC664 TaxID=2801917 RepID=UPI001749AC72|nr:cytochrome P450 [Comamonas sp. JC664]MBL0693132.1 cytochrome P450 [Comamonas sp. JC664]GHG96940.1 cytochrome P450 [Comamonas sp. KCTC 72670]
MSLHPAGASTAAPLPPSPSGTPLLGHMRVLRKDPLTFLQAQVRQYGDVVRVHIGPASLVVVAHPDGVRHVLQDQARRYGKRTRGFAALRELLGHGLLTSEGSFWLRQRRLAQPAFHRQRLAGFARTMVGAASDLASELESRADAGVAFNVAEDCMRLTLRIASATLFGQDVSGAWHDIADAMGRVQVFTYKRLTQALPIPRRLPLPTHRRFERDTHTLDRVVRGIIETRRRDTGEHHDLLQMMLEQHDADTGERMSDTQLRDEVLTMLLAGHETTANALSWTFMLLSQHPSVRRDVEAELAQALGGRAPTDEDLPRLALTRRVVDESLRLYPPAWSLSRVAVEDDVIGGFRIPKGTYLLLSPWVTHRHPRVWDNPEGFDPDRFLPEHEQERPRFAWFPFGGGPRQCIGNQFALMELVLVLATMLQRVRLNLTPGQVIRPAAAITLRPRPGVWVTATRVR